MSTTTCWTSGAGGPRRCEEGRWSAATTSPRRLRRRPTPSCARSSESEEHQMTTEPEPTQPAVPAAFKRTELQRFPSPIPGWEIVQSLAEIPKGVSSGRHSHPGGPEVGYIVRGDVAMEFDDRPTLTLRTGDPFMIPPGVIHNARNIGTVTTKMLSTYVVDAAQPLATLFS